MKLVPTPAPCGRPGGNALPASQVTVRPRKRNAAIGAFREPELPVVGYFEFWSAFSCTALWRNISISLIDPWDWF